MVETERDNLLELAKFNELLGQTLKKLTKSLLSQKRKTADFSSKMNSICASQKKIQKVLRNRRISVPSVPIKPMKAGLPIQRKTKKIKLDEVATSTNASNFEYNKTADISEGSLDSIGKAHIEGVCSSIGEAPGNGEKNTKSNLDIEREESEIFQRELQVSSRYEKERADESSGSEKSCFSDGNQSEENEGDESDSELENQENQVLQETESEDSDADCVESVLKEFEKDIGALYAKTNNIESDVKEIKEILKARPRQHCAYQSMSSRFKQKSAYSLLPKLPLLKKSHVRKMESNADEDEDYKDQFAKKLASFGGKTVNELMINIFKKLFSSKLKTKFCWKGSKKGKGKAAFKHLTSVREILWCAVKIHFEDCTENMIDKEIKLRLNQAQKDYDREMEKKQSNL